MKVFYSDNKDVQQISLIEDELQFIGEGDPERLLDEFHALGYDLAYKDQPLTPAYLAKSIAEYSTPEEGCTQMFCLYDALFTYMCLDGDYAEWMSP